MIKGFDSELYLAEQTKKIVERIARFDEKLYIEFGGKLFDDLHAARVLPGFDANVKTRLLQNLKAKLEVVFCIRAEDIERSKIRADFGIGYDMDVVRLTESLRRLEILVSSIVITQFRGQPAAEAFKNKLERMGERVYIHRPTKGYAEMDVKTIVSDAGYGANDYVETTKPLVVVTAPGPCSGKLGTCLSQLYHELRRGVRAGYAKFETFPVWNLSLDHPVNAAYEAATADLKDRNMFDSYHLREYGVQSVNYNRDIECFAVLKEILTEIGSGCAYKSPTDMGVNMVRAAITDDAVCRAAAKQEIIRRYLKSRCDYKNGLVGIETVGRIAEVMTELGLAASERRVVGPALERARALGCAAIALELADGTIISGRSTGQLKESASVIFNAVKHLAGIDDAVKLIPPAVFDPIVVLKRDMLGAKSISLSLEEALLALSVTASGDKTAERALRQLPLLRGAEAHGSVMLDEKELQSFRKLGINITTEAEKFIAPN